MKAFRAYFDFDDYLPEAEGASSRIAMSFGNSTGINEIINRKSSNSKCYDLQGRPVERSTFNVQHSTLKKGVYVKDGKKVIIK